MNISFKYGKFENLKNLGLNPGQISVTTDTHSMFVDLPVSIENGTLETQRFRLSDFERYENLQALVENKKNWIAGSLALIENSDNKNGANTIPILAYYDGNSWVNINDTGALQQALESQIKANADAIKDLQDKDTIINAALDALEDRIETNEGDIKTIQDEIGTKPAGSSTIWNAISNIVGDSSQSLGALESKIDEVKKGLQSETGERTAADNALSNRITDLENNKANYATITQVNDAKQDAINTAAADATSKANAAEASAKSHTDSKITEEANARAAADNATNERITTLLGESDNEGKSIHWIITKYLTTVNEDETLDKLEEIAAWIQSHPGEAADMNAAILALQAKTSLGTYKDASNKDVEYATVKAYVEAVESALSAQINGVDSKFLWTTF